MVIALSIVFVIVGVILAGIILMQEGRTQGLGSISGMADSYFGKVKGRTMEGLLQNITKYGAILFFILALVLNYLQKT